MKVLIACEFSGTVRDAFLARGHAAWSCDFLPTESPGPHFQCNVLNILDQEWDLMIAHPPCQYLAISGARWWKDRQYEQKLALKFVHLLMNAPIRKICIENPKSIISTRIRSPDQIIQPYQFGHKESKATCLWLKNLPPLHPTDIIPFPDSGLWDNQIAKHVGSKQNAIGGKERAKKRSVTYSGIAKAMSEQWG